MDKDKKRPTDKDGKELHEELDLGQEDEDALDRAWDRIAKERGKGNLSSGKQPALK